MKRERNNNLFKHVPGSRVSRNMFDLSHEVKMSGKFGYLYPILCVDTLPGDTFRDTTSIMLRFAPMLAPVMHRLDVTTHFFYVPYRVLCDSWQDFITGGQDGLSDVVLPYVTSEGPYNYDVEGWKLVQKGSLWDYLGLPVAGAVPTLPSLTKISALPFKACAKVWNDYYRDPNFDDEMDLMTDVQGDQFLTGPLSVKMMRMMDIGNYRRMFEKDYFTSALPWAQRGAEVLIPLAGVGEGTVNYLAQSEVVTDSLGTSGTQDLDATFNGVSGRAGLDLDPSNAGARIENIDSIDVSVDNATSTINDLRRALAIQRWLENNARGGARYTEQIQSHFNVVVPDYRLQRAEYLGGGKQPVQISEVLATAQTETETAEIPVGDMAGHGLSVGRTNRFTYRCQEHGVIVGFMSVTMRTAYQQGVPRMWLRQNKFDFPWPELAHLGEQEIQSQEVFYSFDYADDPANNALFGYIPRYAECKFQNDRVAGDFRDTLLFWHEGRVFSERPALDEFFTTIYENGEGESYDSSFRRIFAVQDGTDYLWIQLYHHLTAKRPLPYFGVPNII